MKMQSESKTQDADQFVAITGLNIEEEEQIGWQVREKCLETEFTSVGDDEIIGVCKADNKASSISFQRDETVSPENVPKQEVILHDQHQQGTEIISLKTEQQHIEIKSNESLSESMGIGLPAVRNFIRERGISISSALRRLSFNEDEQQPDHDKPQKIISSTFNFSRKTTDNNTPLLQMNDETQDTMKGRITLFSRSGCRDCCAMRSFLREKGLKFVEINMDVYPLRRAELQKRTGSASVPQIFLNEHLFGGIVAVNSLRNSGEFDRRLEQVMENRCPPSAPAMPVYGVDDPEDEKPDEMRNEVRILRKKLPIQDRFVKMRVISNCFTGTEAVEALIQELDCGRKKAIEIGKRIARKNFFHHVLQENEFEDGNHLYRFLEHDPTISTKCFNFRVFTNDEEPKPAALVGERLRKIMIAILETYVSDDGRHVDYRGISSSEEFRRYVIMVQDLQRVDILALTREERLALFLNIYNSMVIHATIQQGYPDGIMERRQFFNEFHYVIGGYPYSLSSIQNGIFRANKRPPYSLGKPFKLGDKRLEVALPKENILSHFALCNGSKSSSALRFYSCEGVDAEMRSATREFFRGDGIIIDIEKGTVHLSKLLKWFSADFGQQNEILNWVMDYLDAPKAGLLSHILNNKGPIDVVYQNYDWSLNL
eukprot:Gb_19671 [translate_table: standard]